MRWRRIERFFSGSAGVASAGLSNAQPVAIDATTMEANAAMRSIRRRYDDRKYEEYLKGVAEAKASRPRCGSRWRGWTASGRRRPATRSGRARAIRVRIAKMKDGRRHLRHKAEHAVDLACGAAMAVTLQAADQGDTTTVHETLAETQANAQQIVHGRGVEEVVADQGHHSGAPLVELNQGSVRTYTRRWLAYIRVCSVSRPCHFRRPRSGSRMVS